MSTTVAPTQPRQPFRVSRSREKWRSLNDRLFGCTGFACTFFGLAALLVLLTNLGLDCAAWFRTMPGLIAVGNQELAALVPTLVEDQLRELDRQCADLIAQEPDPQKKKEIQEQFDNIKPRKRAELAQTVQEKQAELAAQRTDTSGAALLWHFLTAGPSNQPQDAGIWPALLGSIWLGIITVLVAVPVGVGAALYLEEYSQRNWLAKVIQININNLAGVPSVVFGILGAYVFVELIFKPLESPVIAARNVLGGGLTLALLTLPVVIVSAQEAIRAVPISIRHGAYALGATRWQTVWTLVLPASLPGILTGTILAMARAMGEAAPLVLFGALLFVNQEPTLFSRFTVLPMQIFGWADRPEDAWRYNAALASVFLLVTLLALNGLAIWLRYRARRNVRW